MSFFDAKEIIPTVFFSFFPFLLEKEHAHAFGLKTKSSTRIFSAVTFGVASMRE
jgi:hypothetical protein